MNSKNSKFKKIDPVLFEDAALKLKIRQNKMILDQIEGNIDKNYFDFASTLSLFDSLEKSSYERAIINEIDLIGQKDSLKDPLANQKLVNEHIFFMQEQAKLKKQLSDLEKDNARLEKMQKPM